MLLTDSYITSYSSMSEKSKIDESRAQLRKSRDKLSNIWEIVWPPSLEVFKSPRLTFKAIGGSSRLLQSIVAISFIGVIISLLFITFGVYNLLTVEEPSTGGYMREVAINSPLETFNPVLELNNAAERRISELLYLPLYYVEYPNFASDPLRDPTITSVLLSSPPQWLDADNPDPVQRFKTLSFALKDNLSWSDDSPITTDDIKYSFDRLKEARGNSQFREPFQNITFERVSDTEFHLISSISNPQLQYTSNFSPIPKQYFSSQNTDRLFTDPRSSAPAITSGYYAFLEEEVIDPDIDSEEKVANPIRQEGAQAIRKVVLQKNTVTNFQEAQVEEYIYHNLDGIFSEPESDTLEDLHNQGEVDLFTRLLGTNLSLAPSDLTDRIDLGQDIVPTNTFYTLYLNIRSGEIFVNQTLRRYVLCKLLTFNTKSQYNEFLTKVPQNKAITPLQLGGVSEPDCPANPDEALDSSVYSFRDNPDNGNRELLIFGLPTSISMVGVSDSQPLLGDLVNFFAQEVGIPAELTSDATEVENKLRDKEYNIAFLPVTYVSKDLNPIYGQSGRDISEITRNRRVDPDAFEVSLAQYALSNYQDIAARDSLSAFFQREYISLNMYQLNQEYNYSDRIINLEQNIPSLHVFSSDLYRTLPDWFTNTRRSLK